MNFLHKKPKFAENTGTMSNEKWKQLLDERSDRSKREILQRFFKTGKGEYGEGDQFIGLSVPRNREVSRMFHGAPLEDIDEMIADEIHEYRLAGWLALVERYRKAKATHERQEIAEHYLAECHRANNWDLVDLSAPYIVGKELSEGRCMEEIRHLSWSTVLWERRVAVVSTLMPIRSGNCDPAFEMCGVLITDPHPLIRKAVGWVLRECGKKDRRRLEDFLEKHINEISALTLSYSTERFSREDRIYWRNRRKNKSRLLADVILM